MENVDSGAIAGFMMIFWIIWSVFMVFVVVCLWKIFEKAGQPGWAAIIPIYNVIILLQIVNRPIWWIILLFIPIVNVVMGFVLAFDLAKSFGKGTGFALGLVFLSLIFYAILAFGDAEYIGNQSALN
jgi:hypothetical protein